jgi:hypothetical protein
VSWLAILLAIAGIGGAPLQDAKPRTCPAGKHAPAKGKPCKKKARKAPAKPTKPRADKPSADPSPRTDAPRPGAPESPRADATPTPTPRPGATPSPTPTPTPVATPTPAPPGTYPTRTNVREWSVRPSYRILAAGRIDFNVNNRGEDDHDLTVRDGSRDLGQIALSPGDTGTLTVELGLGTYTLYCSLPTHEAAGMKATINVR